MNIHHQRMDLQLMVIVVESRVLSNVIQGGYLGLTMWLNYRNFIVARSRDQLPRFLSRVNSDRDLSKPYRSRRNLRERAALCAIKRNHGHFQLVSYQAR